MKKVYSSKAKTTVYALSPEQLKVFRDAGYQTSTPEQVIADAANTRLIPPDGARALAIFDFNTGVFSVRVKTSILGPGETSNFVGEVVAADMLRLMAEQADPDRQLAAVPHNVAAQPTGQVTGPANPAGAGPWTAPPMAQAGMLPVNVAPVAGQSADTGLGLDKMMTDMFRVALLNAFNKSIEKAAGDMQAPAAQVIAGPEVAE